ncbi:hypothetical protein LUZ60_004287 [Juncus effusus]|nr:hypothetical protein LUZ60_004287 [Juncus effusus]
MTAGDGRSPAAAEKPWTRDEDKAFETALATSDAAAEGRRRWEGIAALVPSRTAEEVRRHYDLLVDDVKAIEEGRVGLPAYALGEEDEKELGFEKSSTKLSRSEQERRKGIPWTEKEHKLFLLGLEKFGKGDWRSISRNYVTSRTPTQVASHAQKYFIRLNSMNRDRRRSSIHDITTDLSAPKCNTAGTPMSHVVPPPVQGVAVYGQPVPGHGPVPAVGTPVMFPPQPVPGHSPYAVPVGYPAPAAIPVPPPPMNLH